MKPSNPTKVFKITRSDDVIYNASGFGYLLSFIADKTEFNPDTDNQELRICNYMESSTPAPPSPSNPDETTVSITAVIQGKKELKCGFSRSYTAVLSNEDGNTIDWDNVKYGWKIVSDFDVRQTVNGKEIELIIDNDSLIGESFLLQIVKFDNSSVITEIEITVIEGW